MDLTPKSDEVVVVDDVVRKPLLERTLVREDSEVGWDGEREVTVAA